MSPTLALLICVMAELPASSDVSPIPVTGAVVDKAGRPVPDAKIWLTRATRGEEDRRSGMSLYWSARTGESEETPIALVTRTAADGHFRLEIPAAIAARPDPVALAVWAVHGRDDVAVVRLPTIVRSDDPPLRLRLGPSVQTELALTDPDGQPLTEAKVVPTRVREIPVPEPLGQHFACVTDRQGRLVLAGLPPGAVGELRVETPRLRIQRLAVTGDEKTPIALAPVGKIHGRLVAPPEFPQPITGVKVRVRSKVGGFDGSGKGGEAEVNCDPSGRFEVRAIAAGLVAFELVFDHDKGTPLRGEAPRGLVLQPGSKLEITIPLRPTVPVRGVVREKESKRPIAGVQLAFNSQRGGDGIAASDSAGNYAARVVREVNQAFGWPIRMPRPFYQPDGAPEVPQSMPPRDHAELLLPPLELSRGVDLPGIVLDETGKPVAGADVEVTYGQAILTRTDLQGRFVLSGVDPLRELKIEARRGDASSGRTAIVRAGTVAGPLSLTLRRGPTAGLAGRVIDPSGRPVGGAAVRIWRQIRVENSAFLKDPVAGADGSNVLRTGADGRFHISRSLPQGDKYVVAAEAPGACTAQSEPVKLTGGQTTINIILPGIRTVAGRVVDRQNKPVAGVRVFQSGDGPLRTETMTDGAGRFQLPGVIEGPAFVFASKAGYRFGYRKIEADSSPTQLTLARNEEPPARSYKTLDSPLPAEEEKALARRLFLPYAERVLAKGSDVQKFRMITEALQIDPIGVLEKFETIKFSDPEYLDLVRIWLVDALALESLDEVLAQAEASTSAGTRAMCYLGICDVLPDMQKARVRELIEQALLNARAMKSPEDRLAIYGRIADKLIDLGEKERARKLLDEAVELAGSTVKGNKHGFNLGLVAETLARLDLPAALKLLDELAREVKKNDKTDRTYVFVKLYGDIARKLAADAPVDAERLLERIRATGSADASRRILATCTSMARSDPARARRIAETMFDSGTLTLKPSRWAGSPRGWPRPTNPSRSNCSRPRSGNSTIWRKRVNPRPCTAGTDCRRPLANRGGDHARSSCRVSGACPLAPRSVARVCQRGLPGPGNRPACDHDRPL